MSECLLCHVSIYVLLCHSHRSVSGLWVFRWHVIQCNSVCSIKILIIMIMAFCAICQALLCDKEISLRCICEGRFSTSFQTLYVWMKKGLGDPSWPWCRTWRLWPCNDIWASIPLTNEVCELWWKKLKAIKLVRSFFSHIMASKWRMNFSGFQISMRGLREIAPH